MTRLGDNGLSGLQGGLAGRDLRCQFDTRPIQFDQCASWLKLCLESAVGFVQTFNPCSLYPTVLNLDGNLLLCIHRRLQRSLCFLERFGGEFALGACGSVLRARLPQRSDLVGQRIQLGDTGDHLVGFRRTRLFALQRSGGRRERARAGGHRC